MAEYTVDGVVGAQAASETSLHVTISTGADKVGLTMDWRVASELIDTMAAANHQIRMGLAAPDTRADRMRRGCHRLGLVLGLLTAVPALYGAWLWVSGMLDADGGPLVVAIALAAPGIYALLTGIGWTVGAFLGRRERKAA